MNFARFVVRPNTRGNVLGLNKGLFEEGQVYEVTDPGACGEYLVTKLGPSPLSLDEVSWRDDQGRNVREHFGFTNGWSHHQLLMTGGQALMTMAALDQELQRKR